MARLEDEIKQSKPFESKAQESMVSLLRTVHLLRRGVESRLELEGLTMQQYNVLRILRGAPAALPTMEIGERLVESTPGITRLMQRIEKCGWATTQAGEDKRQKLWELSATGQQVLARGDEILQSLETQWFQGFSDSDLESMLDTLGQLRERFRS